MRKIVKGKLGDLKFQLNPTTTNYDGGAVWSQINSPGMSKPIISYSYGKPETFSFELWFNTRHINPVNIQYVFKKLMEYRNSKKPVIFAYGTFVKRVVVLECPISIEALDSKLNLTELKVPVTLQVV